jgi:hypothetical protein
MTDSTDNARGPERIWAVADRRKQWFDKDPHAGMIDGHAVEYIRADLAPDPLADARVAALVDACQGIGEMDLMDDKADDDASGSRRPRCVGHHHRRQG